MGRTALPKLLVFLVLVAACGDDGAPVDASLDARGSSGVRFAVCSLGVSPEGGVGLINGASSLDDVVSAREAVELGGRSPTCASAFGAAFGATSESNVVRRYEPDERGRLIPVDAVSFGGEGISSITSTRSQGFFFIDEGRALYIDRTSATIVVWNPTEMTVTRSFRIEGVDGPGLSIRRVSESQDGVLLLYARYVDDGIALRRSELVRLNLDDLTYTVATDTRCGGLISDVRGSDGSVYLASGAFVSTYSVLGIGSEDDRGCILRVAPGASEFDADYFVSMNDLTGMPTGGLFAAGGNSALVLALDESEVEPGVGTIGELVQSVAWRLHRIDDLTAPDGTTRLDNFSLRPAVDGEGIEIGSRRFLLRIDPTLAGSTLVDVTSTTRSTRCASKERSCSR